MDAAVGDIGPAPSSGLYRRQSLVADCDNRTDAGGAETPLMDAETDAGKPDSKVSRRKTDRPRKRLRNSADSLCEGVSCDRQESLFEDTTHLRDDLDLMTVAGSVGDSKQYSSDTDSSDQFDAIMSPQAPEDLSMRVTLDKNGNLNDQRKLPKDNSCDESLTAQHIGSSMHELQKVVDRHLPSASTKPLTFTPDSLEKDLNHFQKHNTTIQWIGSQQPPVSADTLSAAAILRQLYTSRESVIRSNSRPPPDGPALAPTHDTFKDPLQLNIPQICNNQPYDADLPVSMAINSNHAFNMAHLSPASLGNKYNSHYQEVSLGDGCAGLFETQNANVASRKCSKHQPLPAGLADEDMLMRMAHIPAHRFGQQMGPLDANRPPHAVVAGRVTPTDIYGPRPPQHSAWYELTG